MSTTPSQFSYSAPHRASCDLPALKPLKPPIYNPYDKFPKSEFDAWIGDLTNTLKGALGRLDDVGQQSPDTISHSGNTYIPVDGTAEEVIDDDSVDAEVEDSFADIKARRVIRRGKARDPREGPGFGTGTGEKHQPIEIGSDSDSLDESGESEEGSEHWDTDEGEEEEEEEEEAEEEEEESEEEDQSWLQGESSIQARIRSEGDGLNHLFEYEEGDENDEDYDQEAEDDIGYEAVARPTQRGSPEEIILLSSDEELEGDEGQDFEEQDSFDRHSDRSDAGANAAAVSHPTLHAVNGTDEYETASLNGGFGYTNDFHEVDKTEGVDPEDAQPEDKDTSFHSPTILPTVFRQPVDIPDPWSGPKTYAEDFYSGGDVRAGFDGQSITVDHLGPCDDEGVLQSSRPITPSGDYILTVVDAGGFSDVIDVDLNKLEEIEAREPVVAEEDVLNSRSPLLASAGDMQATDVSELYGDMEVDVQQEEPSREIDLLTVNGHHTSELLLDVISFTVHPGTPHEMQIQEEAYFDPSELSSHFVVEGQPQVEAVGKQPIVDVVEDVAPLFTHNSDSAHEAKALPPPVVVDQEEVEEVPSSGSGFPVPDDSERFKWSSAAPPQHPSHTSSGPDTDIIPPVPFGEHVISCLSSTTEAQLEIPYVVADSSTNSAGHWSHPRTIESGKETDDIAAECIDGDPDAQVMSIGDSERPKDTEQLPTGPYHGPPQAPEPDVTSERRSLLAAEETPLVPQASALTNDTSMHYIALDPSSPGETLQSDTYPSTSVSTDQVAVEHSGFTLIEESSLGDGKPNAPMGLEPPSDLVATRTASDVADQLPAPTEATLANHALSVQPLKILETAQAQASNEDHPVSSDPSRLAEIATGSPVKNEHTSSSGDVNGRSNDENHGNATENQEIWQAAVSEPAPSSLAHTHSQTTPSGLYPLRMVMRKATDPVLFVDPYPYSLSTPGEPQDEASDDEETEQENSLSSSSTFDKFSDDKVKETDVVYENASRKGSMEPSTEFVDGSLPESHDSDTDADGDVDPEFIEADLIASPIHSSSANEAGDPFMDANVQGPVDQREDKGIQLSGTKDDELAVEPPNSSTTDRTRIASPTALPMSRSASELPAILIIKKKPAPAGETKDNENAEAEQLTESPDTPISSTRSSKRRRESQLDASLSRSVPSKRPEKGRVVYQTTHKPRKSLQVREARPAKSQGSLAGKGKGRTSQPGSRNTSRASSIISSAPSDKSSHSIYMHPSPTVDKITTLRPQMPPPLLHTHLRTIPHHHGLPSPAPPFQTQRSIQKSNSFPRQSDSRSTAGPSSHPAPSHRSSSSSSSPVTRSHCRYHRISIPRDEDDGPREYFLVPGCSLGNRDLMIEELIEDHGDASPEDADRSVNDIASVDGLNPYLVGIMRQLVGLDRDQEVYYIPPHGQKLVRKPRHHKTPSDKLALGRVPSYDPMIAANAKGSSGSPRTSVASARSPTSSRAPVSANGSVSTSTSLPRKETYFDPVSALSAAESDHSDEDGSPRSKRARRSFAGDRNLASAIHPLGFDAPKNPGKIDTKKRTRTSEALGEHDVELPRRKKPKTHTGEGTADNTVIPPNGM